MRWVPLRKTRCISGMRKTRIGRISDPFRGRRGPRVCKESRVLPDRKEKPGRKGPGVCKGRRASKGKPAPKAPRESRGQTENREPKARQALKALPVRRVPRGLGVLPAQTALPPFRAPSRQAIPGRKASFMRI